MGRYNLLSGDYMNSKEQKLIIDNLLSSSEVFARCAGILDSEYFDPEYRKAVHYIKEYTDKYGAPPTFDLVNAKFDSLGFKPRKVTHAEMQSSCDDIEEFCQRSALTQAVLAGVQDIDEGNYAALKERIDKASLISLQKDMGVDMFENTEAYLRSLLDNDVYYSTGIKLLDEHLDGGLARKQLTLFSANSGGGKSVMLSNLGVNFATLHGMNVIYISLELAESMIFKRNAFIMSRVNTKAWKDKIGQISSKLRNIHEDGAGSFRIKRLPTGCCINDVRSYLKQYEIEYNTKPDVIILDYLDLLSPNEGVRNMSISEQDKFKSEQLSQLLHDYNAIGLSASQQNREAISMAKPDQSVIAGGLTKVNTVDNFVSLFMDSAGRAKGQMTAFFLKTRSSDGVGKMITLGFDPSCLHIGDLMVGGIATVASRIKKSKKAAEEAEQALNNINESPGDLPGLMPITTPVAKVDEFLDKLSKDVKVETNDKKRENIANLSKLSKTKTSKKSPPISGIDLLEEEEKLTRFGKGPQEEAPIRADSGKILTPEQQEFIEKNGLGKDYIEHIMTFIG
jgi:archaellum biogenesis ATPase FlaH